MLAGWMAHPPNHPPNFPPPVRPRLQVEDQQRLDNLTGQINALLARAAVSGQHAGVSAGLLPLPCWSRTQRAWLELHPLSLLRSSTLQELGEQGEVDASQAATTDAERLKVQRSLAEQQAQSRALARVGGNLKQKVGTGGSRAWGRACSLHGCGRDAGGAGGSAGQGIRGRVLLPAVSLSRAAPSRSSSLPRMQVCPISGLIINDEESRLQDHYSGRNYK